MKLEDTVAIITGASQGIGRGIALKFAEHGADVVVNCRKNDASYITGENLSVDGGSLASMYHLIHQRAPKAIIVSGFSETKRVKGAQSLGAGIYVRKPYSLHKPPALLVVADLREKIGRAVRAELDAVLPAPF